MSMIKPEEYSGANSVQGTVVPAFIERKRLAFFGLPFTFTTYSISRTAITVKSGLLRTSVDDCLLYRVQDVRLARTLTERIFGLGTVTCFTGDVTNPKLELIHIKNAEDIKNWILKTSEEEKIRRKTLSMQHIDIHPDVDDIDL